MLVLEFQWGIEAAIKSQKGNSLLHKNLLMSRPDLHGRILNTDTHVATFLPWKCSSVFPLWLRIGHTALRYPLDLVTFWMISTIRVLDNKVVSMPLKLL